ncbi:MAG: hypothetical protein JWN04_1855 [Myxococcaceae bacterium]|nr:hypothetical protein [Myxococcaceae bacterium]
MTAAWTQALRSLVQAATLAAELLRLLATAADALHHRVHHTVAARQSRRLQPTEGRG